MRCDEERSGTDNGEKMGAHSSGRVALFISWKDADADGFTKLWRKLIQTR